MANDITEALLGIPKIDLRLRADAGKALEVLPKKEAEHEVGSDTRLLYDEAKFFVRCRCRLIITYQTLKVTKPLRTRTNGHSDVTLLTPSRVG